ncbi:MAG: tetratricopeptide repeat protein [Alphaproteobacteria bacterium]|nr:tetratricopeptide repeat protein [Alphaproteobacteria bacterium]
MLEEQNHAIALHRAGRLDEAEAIYRRILKVDPDNAEALHLLGVVAGQFGDHDECVRLIERAISHGPDVAKYHANLGAALTELGRFDEAAQAFERAVALDPDYSEAHYNLGLALESRDRLDEAVASYRRVLEIDPAHADACNNLGVALQLDGRIGEAREYFRRAVAIAADHAPALSNLGRSVLVDGLADEALVHLRRALEITPDDPDVLVSIGDALRERGDIESSEDHLRRAVSIDPDHAGARSRLDSLLGHQGDDRLDEKLSVMATALDAVGTSSIDAMAAPDGSFGYVPIALDDFLDTMFELETCLKNDPDYRHAKHPYRPLSFVEVGCGVGRNVFVLKHASYFGFDKVSGFDVVEEYIERAHRHFDLKKEVFLEDCMSFDFGDIDVVYFYRPFLDTVLEEKFERRLIDSVKRGAYIVAHMPLVLEMSRRIEQRSRSHSIWKKI